MDNKEIAQTIISQLGGGKLVAMTGAKNFVAIENGVQFKIGRNAKSINTVIVRLNSMDTYDIEYGRVAKKKGVPTYTVKTTELNIYNDMLKESFESNTGMYLTF